jgi:hypothetical protein
MGTVPPVTTDSADVQYSVNRIYNKLSGYAFNTGELDNGLYLSVTTGSQKISGIGGITNFPSAFVTQVNSNLNYVIVRYEGLDFVEGDNVDLKWISKGTYKIQENVVKSSKFLTSTELLITFEEPMAPGFILSNKTRTVALTNSKDRKGTLLACLYAATANNFGIDKAPFNVVLDGDSEIFYTRDQLTRLLDARVTPISRNAFDTNGVVIDTPTMALENSDFTDQGTVGLIMYFIRQLRKIAESRKGQRFGSGEAQIVFQTELEAPLAAQVGDSIVAYNLTIDWSNLNIDHSLDVQFSVREAKKLKWVTITARLF